MFKDLSPNRKGLFLFGILNIIISAMWIAIGVGCLANAEFAIGVGDMIGTSLVLGMSTGTLGMVVVVAAIIGIVPAVLTIRAAKKARKAYVSFGFVRPYHACQFSGGVSGGRPN